MWRTVLVCKKKKLVRVVVAGISNHFLIQVTFLTTAPTSQLLVRKY